MPWDIQILLDECAVDRQLRRLCSSADSCSARQLSTCRRIGSKFRCMRSTPTDMQSMSEKDFECFARTGVNTLEMAKVSGKLRQARFLMLAYSSTFPARAVRTWARCPRTAFVITVESCASLQASSPPVTVSQLLGFRNGRLSGIDFVLPASRQDRMEKNNR